MNDDEYGALLLRPLRGEPAGPSRIDPARAMREGRRRRRGWFAGGAAFAAVTATAVAGGVLATAGGPDEPPIPLPPDPAMPAACTVERLPMGGYGMAEVRGGDPSGRYLVGSSDPVAGRKQAVLVWRDGKLIDDVMMPGTSVVMADINRSGVAVGTTVEGVSIPYVYRAGKISKLRGGSGEAIAVNDAGVIAGSLMKGGRVVPVRWATADAEPEPLPAGFDRISDLAEDGTIAGRTEGGAALWLPDGSLRQIESPGSAGFTPVVFRHGWLYGMMAGSSSGPAQPNPYRYDPRSGTWQRLGTGSFTVQLAGPGTMESFASAVPEVFVGGRTLKLPPYQPAVAYGDAFIVESISDDFRTIGGSSVSGFADPERPIQPLLWRCR